jgi:hypothetical protein
MRHHAPFVDANLRQILQKGFRVPLDTFCQPGNAEGYELFKSVVGPVVACHRLAPYATTRGRQQYAPLLGDVYGET